MKTLLILLVVAICAIGYRSPEVMRAVGLAGAAQDPASISVDSLLKADPQPQQKPMSMEEFAAMSQSDPAAYQKFLNSHQVQERSEVDKLLNFFSRGKYE